MEKILSIKEMISMVEPNVLEVEYRKALFYLTPLILRTEKTLIEAQKRGDYARAAQVESSYKTLVFVYGHIDKQDSRIKELESQNKLLTERLKLYEQAKP